MLERASVSGRRETLYPARRNWREALRFNATSGQRSQWCDFGRSRISIAAGNASPESLAYREWDFCDRDHKPAEG